MREHDNYLLVKGSAGMGNRLVSVLTAILYARLTGRLVYIDWSDPVYSPDGSNVFTDYFTGKQRDLLTTIPDTDSVHPAIWRGRLKQQKSALVEPLGGKGRIGPWLWAKTSADPARIDYPQKVVVMWAYAEQVYRMRKFLPGSAPEFSGMPTPQILRRLFREELILAPSIAEQIEHLQAPLLRLPTIGVHARYSDKRSRLPFLRKHVDGLLKKHPGMQLFVATDNETVLKQFEQDYGTVVSAPKWYPSPGLPMHRWSDCPDPKQQGVDALVDMYLLASCDYMVMDESSSFAAAVRWITDIPAERIMNVHRHSRLPPYVRYWAWLSKRTLQHRLGLLPNQARNSVRLARKDISDA